MKKNKLLTNIFSFIIFFTVIAFSVNAVQSNVDIRTTGETGYNNKELRSDGVGVAVHNDLDITTQAESEGNTTVTVKLRNGQKREIMIMPDVASEKALEMLKVRVCSSDNNCTIQLKSVGNGTSEKIQYEMKMEQNSKVLGLFPKKMQVSANVNAKTGVTRVHRPWWAFIATVSAE